MPEPPEPYLPIADYGVIGNLRTVALVGTNGSIDWCCLPSLDSPSVFAALLDHRRGGRFRVAPAGAHASRQRYLPGTNVLRTRFRTEGGALSVTDFMPVEGLLRGKPHSEPAAEIHRVARCDGGEAELRVEWSPRFDFARAPTRVERTERGFVAHGGGEALLLEGFPPESGEVVEDGHGPVVTACLRLREGERAELVTRRGAGGGAHPPGRSLAALRETVHAWRGWSHVCVPPGGCAFAGPLHERAVRSALVLKLLTHRHTGAVAAAPTTSLPEEVGGVRNWDYRFSWVRDSALTAQALFAVGHAEEARDFLRWVEQVSWETGERGYDLQVMYTLHGETELPERELPHLEGYRGSRPVRIGNAASEQLQLDIYGELMSAAFELHRMEGGLAPRMWPFLCAVADHVCHSWRRPDSGIWEVRSEPLHFVHSKVMAWVALDRALRLAGRMRLPAPVRRWRREREAIRRAVLTEGWDPRQGAFVRSFGSRDLDAANLLMPLVEFLPPRDPRVQGTIDRTMERLMTEGMVYRYRAEDGLPGGEGVFVLCTFWLADALTLSGRLREAREVFSAMAGRANHLGLYAEEVDPRTGEFRGNFPQAFSHAAFLNSALYLARAEGRRAPAPAPMGSREHAADAGHRNEAAV